jgi:hypothetical protein
MTENDILSKEGTVLPKRFGNNNDPRWHDIFAVTPRQWMHSYVQLYIRSDPFYCSCAWTVVILSPSMELSLVLGKTLVCN